MAMTAATQAELDSAALRFEQVNGELQAMLRTLMGELEGMRDRWQGAGGRSFDAVRGAWADGLAKLNDSLLATASGIRSAGRSYDISDDQASHAMRATMPGRLDLPL